MNFDFAHTLFLAGPTAVGKSAAALELADQLGGEIISVDSMQVYRGLDLGTAKPSEAERRRVPHHLLDVVDLHEAFDAAQFVRLATAAARGIRERGRRVIFCGGTGLYFKALLAGLGDSPPADPQVRAALEATPLPELLRELAERDPAAFAAIDRQNPRRIVRALEVIRLSGKPFSAQRAKWSGGSPALQASPGLGLPPAPVLSAGAGQAARRAEAGERPPAVDPLEEEPAALHESNVRGAGFQPAVSPTSSRQDGRGGDARRVGNPRHSRLEVCGTHQPRFMGGEQVRKEPAASQESSGPTQEPLPAPFFALMRSPDDLRARVDDRVDVMFGRGLVAETRRLLECGLGQNRTALQAIGYRQVVEHLQGKRSLEATVALVKHRTWQFARRQATWFRHQLPCQWLALTPGDSPATIARMIADQAETLWGEAKARSDPPTAGQ